MAFRDHQPFYRTSYVGSDMKRTSLMTMLQRGKGVLQLSVAFGFETLQSLFQSGDLVFESIGLDHRHGSIE